MGSIKKKIGIAVSAAGLLAVAVTFADYRYEGKCNCQPVCWQLKLPAYV